MLKNILEDEQKMIIETSRLILRPPTEDDFEALYSLGNHPENVRYMGWWPETEKDMRNVLANAKPGKNFVICLKESGKVIGNCGISSIEDSCTGELNWILHIDYWGQGYGTEVCAELIRYGFEDLKLRRITAPCAAVNYGSCRVIERNGMRLEATHIKAFWTKVDKEWVDEAVYAILAEEYFRR
ncbi:MAG: GNAT family N-acetyltransferase [Oscillospiraceae bacterium]|nr:GNAT family N-acetyltransferase [Oscillospiraceae bacterium]